MACARSRAGARLFEIPLMRLQLRDHLSWCDCAGRAVFLDTQGDRYFCLARSANDAFLRFAAGEARPEDAEALRLLSSRGMLTEGRAREPVAASPRIEAVTGDFMDGRPGRLRLIPILRALAAELGASWSLRTKPFGKVIEAAGRSRPRRGKIPQKPDQRVEEIISASNALSFVLRSHDRCLVRALAVHLMCKKSGIRSKLVFGVIAHPFTAHCWVQLESAVLVGGYEQARLYTPILMLE
jgi:hypothetical protein